MRGLPSKKRPGCCGGKGGLAVVGQPWDGRAASARLRGPSPTRPERALAAVRRRIYLPAGVVWHVEMIGEKARFADQLGLTREAIEAYRQYVAFREHAEPPFRERADQARARLAALAGGRQ